MRLRSTLPLVFVFLIPLLGQKQEGAQTLRGRVFDPISDAPHADMELNLHNMQWKPIAIPVRTNAQGAFVFRGVAPGNYVLSATRSDIGTVYFRASADGQTIHVINIPPDDKETVVEFPIYKRSVVSGRVLDEQGEPAARAQVSLQRAVWRDGRLDFNRTMQGISDDRGQFRLEGVASGAYTICAGPANQMMRVAAIGSIDYAAPAKARAFVRTCQPADGTFEIGPGQSRQMNLKIESRGLVSISGRLPATLAAIPSVRLVSATDPGGQQLIGVVDPVRKTFLFHNVPEDSYRIESEVATAGPGGVANRLVASTAVMAGATDLKDIELSFDPPSRIEVVFEQPPEKNWAKSFERVTLRSATAVPSKRFNATSAAGRRIFDNIPAGEYWLETRTDGDTCVTSAKLGERDVTRRKITVLPGMTTSLVLGLSASCGAIEGRVTMLGKPAGGAKIMLMLSGTPSDPGDCFTLTTDPDGTFAFFNLPPGLYKIWSWQEDEQGTYPGPASLVSSEKFSTAIETGTGRPVWAEINPIPRNKEPTLQ